MLSAAALSDLSQLGLKWIFWILYEAKLMRCPTVRT
jgi:hypothetical protein